MKNQEEIIEDLKGLISILNDGKIGYKDAIENVTSEELKAVFSESSNQRAEFANELKEHILEHVKNSDNEDGSILDVLHRTWLDIKEVFASDEDSAILDAIKTGEQAALAKYDEVLENYRDHADHYALLSKQRQAIQIVFNKIELLLLAYQD